MSSSDIITSIRDPEHDLGKKFSVESDGVTARKDATVRLSAGIAVQRHIPDINALKDLLTEVSEDPTAAICNSVFPLIPLEKEFLLYSEDKLRGSGYLRNDPSITWPVTIKFNGENWPALGRFKEHTAPSSWILLDRDIDEHTPPHYAELDYDGWLSEVDKLLPGISKCARLRAHSSSARVSVAGVPVGGGNGHTWVQLANAVDVLRLRSVVKARAIAMDMTWKKPKRSRTTGDVVAYDVVSIIDWSVFTPGRLVFVGKPVLQDV